MYKPMYIIIANTSSTKRTEIMQVQARDRKEALKKAESKGAYRIKAITRCKQGIDKV